MSNIGSIDLVAWWGAITGSLALLWEVFAWHRSRPTLRIDNIVVTKKEVDSYHGVQDVVIFTVTNVGEQATTVSEFGFLHSLDWWHRIRKKYDVEGREWRHPHTLEPLHPFGLILPLPPPTKTDVLTQGILVVWVKDASRKRPTTARVRRRHPDKSG